MAEVTRQAENTDRELWRRTPDSLYSPSIHVTKDGLIAIDVGGHVVGMSVEAWHDLGKSALNTKGK